MIVIIRQPRWEKRLTDYLTQVATRKFDRGSFDCVRFVAGAIQEMTGVDLAADFRHKYQTDAEAKKIIDDAGPDGLHVLVDKVFTDAGFQKVDWKHAFRGDPCFFSSLTDFGGLGICVGAYALSPTKEGLRQKAMSGARTIWHIPYHG